MLVKVKFIQYGKLSSKSYDYETWIEDLIPYDYVVVETGDHFSIAVFQGYIDEEKRQDFEYKFIVQKLPVSLYEELKQAYEEENND